MPQIAVHQLAKFTEQLKQLENEARFHELAARLQTYPGLGSVIAGTGGLRKIRVGMPGRGKRGGARIIYLWLQESGQLIFMRLYAKMKRKTLPPKRKRLSRPSRLSSKPSSEATGRRADKSFGEDLIEAMEEVLAFAQGKITLQEVILPTQVRGIKPAEIKRLRNEMNVSQAMFAAILNVPTVTAISWEKGRRKPTGAALRLLDLARKDPRRVFELAHLRDPD